MPLFKSTSIRKNLITLIIIMAAVPCVIVAYSAFVEREREIQDAIGNATRHINQTSHYLTQLARSSELFLNTLSRLPVVQHHDEMAVNNLLIDMVKQYPQFSSFFIVDKAGVRWASTNPITNAISYADRRYFINAISSGRFSSGEYAVGKIKGRPVFSFALPVKDSTGTIIGVGVASIELNSLTELNKKTNYESLSVVILDHNGTILFNSTNAERNGTREQETIFRQMRDGGEEGVLQTDSSNPKIISYQKLRLSGETAPYMYICAEIPRNLLMKDPNRRLAVSMVVLLFGTTASLLLAFNISKRNLLKKVDESDRRFRSFIENANDVTFVLTPEGIFDYVSPQWETAFGYQSSATIGQPFQNFVHPDDVAGCAAFLRLVLESGEKQSGVEYRVLCKNGAYLWYRANASITQEPDTGKLSVIGIGRDITDQRQAADALRSSVQLYHSMVETSQDLIWQCDTEGVFTYQNLAWEQTLGYELNEMKGKQFYNFQTSEEAARLQKEFERLLQGESIEQFETIFTGKSGIATYLVLNALYLTNDKGEISGASGTAHDITQRKQIENELRESEEKYRILLEESSDAIFSLTPEGRYIYANIAFAQNTGKAVDEIIGNTLWDVFPHDEANKRFASLNNAFRTGKSEELEVCIPATDGNRYFMTTINPVVNKEGKVLAAVCSARNITRLKLTENELIEMTNTLERQKLELQQVNESLEQQVEKRTAELKNERQKLESIIRGTNIGTWEWNIQTGETRFNKRWAEIIGYTLEELSPISIETWIRFSHPDDLIASNALLEKHFRGELEYYVFETRMKHKDGSWIWIADRGKVDTWTEDGKPLLMFGTHQDISGRKKMEQQLIQSQKLESIGRLAGGVAHDFNNKLSVIMGYAELASEELQGNSDIIAYLQEITRAAEFSRDITSQLLAFSRQQIVSPRKVDVNYIIYENLKSLSRLIGEEIQIIFNPFEDLWPIKIDPVQIEQIIMNLAVNARDAMTNGGTLTIATANYRIQEDTGLQTGRADGDYVELSFTDTGTGIDEKTLSHIFEPFFTTKEIGKGTGLGLATIHGIVTQNDGFIDVESTPGTGTTFRILFSRHIEDVPETVSFEDDPVKCSGSILLVEDDGAVRTMIAIMLDRFGYDVTSCATPHKAIECCEQQESGFDLIITDIVMPAMNGKEMVDHIRSIKKDIKVLYMSGHTSEIISQKGVLLEHINFIQKPINSADMKKKIAEILNA